MSRPRSRRFPLWVTLHLSLPEWLLDIAPVEEPSRDVSMHIWERPDSRAGRENECETTDCGSNPVPGGLRCLEHERELQERVRNELFVRAHLRCRTPDCGQLWDYNSPPDDSRCARHSKYVVADFPFHVSGCAECEDEAAIYGHGRCAAHARECHLSQVETCPVDGCIRLSYPGPSSGKCWPHLQVEKMCTGRGCQEYRDFDREDRQRLDYCRYHEHAGPDTAFPEFPEQSGRGTLTCNEAGCHHPWNWKSPEGLCDLHQDWPGCPRHLAPGFVYLFKSELQQCYKVGRTVSIDYRLDNLADQEYTLVGHAFFPEPGQSQLVERALLREIRRRGWPEGVPPHVEGHTETFPLTVASPAEVESLFKHMTSNTDVARLND